MNDRNKSTAQDVAMLCYRVLRDVLMQKIVSTKIYFSEIIDDEVLVPIISQGFSKEIFWENTNKMLYKGYVGVKTGITNKAGPCVVEHYRDDKRNLILVLLNCKSVDERWVDAAKLVDWVKARES
jgi:D-alanyl-D-alanine carboxypeptidase